MEIETLKETMIPELVSWSSNVCAPKFKFV